MSEQEARQAQFSRTAAHIINSPYFSDPERILQEMEGDEDKAVEEFHRREQEYYVLIEAVQQAQTEDDLSPEAKKVLDHVQRQIENDAVWQERIYGETEFSAKMEPEASRLMGPNSEDSALLAQAIAEAHQQGDTDTAKKLSELSRTPWKIRQALGHDGAIETFPEEQSARREDIKPKVKPSPLRREKY